MKMLLRYLMLTILFAAPVFGQGASVSLQPADTGPGNDAAVVTAQTQAVPAEKMQESYFAFPWLRSMGGLGLVLCLMVGGYFAARKLAPGYFAKRTSEKNLKVVETLSMGDKRSISMIEVGGSRFLVGSTPNQISFLLSLPEPVSLVSEPESASAKATETAEKESLTSFRKLFEVEKKRPTQYAGNPLPEDIRTKMRQLREALER